jgi:hypothetical protein
MTREKAAREFGQRLRRLAEWRVGEKRNLKAWYAAAHEVADWAQATPSVAEVPHFFWHYISDADIRLKDLDYARLQDERVWELIAILESGAFPGWD